MLVWALLGQILAMISLLPTLVVWPIGLTFALGPPLLFQPLWMGSTAAAAWMVSPPLEGQGNSLSAPGSHSSQAMGSPRREGRERERSGTSKAKFPFTAPS